MYMPTNETQRSFRDVRAHLAEVCNAEHATFVLDRHRPRAIIVPLKLQRPYSPGPKDKGIANAKRHFTAAVLTLRTH